MNRLVLLLLVALSSGASGCRSFGDGYRQDLETLRYLGPSFETAHRNENDVLALWEAAVVDGTVRESFSASVQRGWATDLDHWRK